MADRLRLEGVCFSHGAQALLTDVCFGVPEGGALVVAGRSGSGKSTMLEIAAGLSQPQRGSVLWGGRRLEELSSREMTATRRKMGYLFQQHALIHNYTLFDNLALPLRYCGDLTDQEVRSRVREQMGRFGLLPLANLLPEALSVGQARCAALARAVIMEPEVLFLDEPTSSLDPVTTGVVVNILAELRSRKPVTLLVISYNAFLARQLSCSIKVLEKGRLHDLDEYKESADLMMPDIASFLRGAL